MNYRRTIAAVGLAGVLALAACGTNDQTAEPAARPAAAAQDASAANQHAARIARINEDDVRSPAVSGELAGAAVGWPGDAKDHAGYSTGPAAGPVSNGDAKDHPGYRTAPAAGPVSNGDAKDHPGYRTAPAAGPVSNGDAKDHPGYGQIEPAGSAVAA